MRNHDERHEHLDAARRGRRKGTTSCERQHRRLQNDDADEGQNVCAGVRAWSAKVDEVPVESQRQRLLDHERQGPQAQDNREVDLESPLQERALRPIDGHGDETPENSLSPRVEASTARHSNYYPKNCCLIAFLNASSPICKRAAYVAFPSAPAT